MEFRLLGPVEVSAAGGPLPLGGAKARTLLAALLLAPRQVVSVERLIDVIWDADPPATARALIQTYISGLRRLIGGEEDLILTQPPGYLARVPDADLDRYRFDWLVAQGRAAAASGDHRGASDAFRAAEALWRGPALGGVRSNALAVEALRLDEQRLGVVEERIAADLALGRGDELAGELAVLVGQNPTREGLRGQLMLALHRAGRTADALSVFREGRQFLVDELGIEPGPQLTRLHEAILRADPALLPAAVVPARHSPAGGGPPTATPPPSNPSRRRGGPAQLPPAPADFTGREAQVRELTALLHQARTATTVGVVAGPGGVGKSALAVHVAHQVAARYPDGQLHVDLRGTDREPASAAEVLARFLRAFDVEPAGIPESLPERMDRYRTLLSGRRVLIILDDAADEQQLRPLLPGSPTCAVIVTSRSRLPGLAAAHLVELEMLSEPEATELLARIAGEERIRSAPEAAAQIVACCGRLPLAVRIAGARLASRRHWSPQRLAGRLADERRRLNELWVGDQQIRSTIELSFQALDPAAQVVLRRLGQLGPSDFPCWVVAALLDTDMATAESKTEQLVDAHLVDYTYVDHAGHVRYRVHDLVRIYARERAEEVESRADRVAYTARVAGGWLWLVQQLTDHIADHVTSGAIVLSPGAEAYPLDPDLAAAALADPRGWLDTEQSSLVSAIERAADLDLDALAVAIAAAVCASAYPLNRDFDAWTRAHEAALGAARRAGNTHGEAIMIAELGQLRYEQDRNAEARLHQSRALEMFRDLGDSRGQAASLTAIGLACREQGYLPEAQHFLGQAAAICDKLSDDRATGHCARIAGSVHMEQGDFVAADALLDTALAAYRRAGSRRGAALTLRTIGLARRARGQRDAAEEALTEALATFRDLGDARLESFSLRALGKVIMRQGRLAEARTLIETALAADRAVGDRWAEAMALRTLGELCLAEGAHDLAERHLIEAMATFEEVEAPLFKARTLRDVALLRQACGQHAAARAAHAEAVEIFRIYGSREYAELTGAPLQPF